MMGDARWKISNRASTLMGYRKCIRKISMVQKVPSSLFDNLSWWHNLDGRKIMRYTIKDIDSMYKGKTYGDGKFAELITKIVHSEYRDGRKISILCSGKFKRDESGYCIEAIIDRASGKNLIPERNRPAENTIDIIDVAWEMLDEEL